LQAALINLVVIFTFYYLFALHTLFGNGSNYSQRV